MTAELSSKEEDRYFRQLFVKEWNQEKLKQAKVFVAGVGGLGSASTYYLAAAGIGTIHICDGDIVERVDLNRQILYSEKSIGKPKVEEAYRRLSMLNPEIKIDITNGYLTKKNVSTLIDGYDIIVDGLDNVETRLLLNTLSIEKGIPYAYGTVQGWEGFLSLFNPPATACFSCVMDEGLEEKITPTLVPGVLPGIIGAIQASEVIKYLMDVERTSLGKLMVYDSRRLAFDVITIEKNPNCSCNKL